MRRPSSEDRVVRMGLPSGPAGPPEIAQVFQNCNLPVLDAVGSERVSLLTAGLLVSGDSERLGAHRDGMNRFVVMECW